MKVKLFIYMLLLTGFLQAIAINHLDLPLEINGGNKYHFFEQGTKKGYINLSLSTIDDSGMYTVEIENFSGTFSSGWEEMSYRLEKSPYIDMVNKCFKFFIDEKETSKHFPILLSFSEEKLLAPGTYTTEIPIIIKKDDKIILKKNLTAYFSVEEQLEAKIYLDKEERDKENVSLNFGTLDGSIEKDIRFSVKANTSIKVSISSKNKGRMIFEGEEQEKYTPYYIPYTLQSRGEEISLATKTTLFSKEYTPNMKEVITKIRFFVRPNMQQNFSGKYYDRVCITISSL